jgi:hypothetical protein
VVDHLFRVVGHSRVFVGGADCEHGVEETLAGFGGFSGTGVVLHDLALEKRHVLLKAVLETNGENCFRASLFRPALIRFSVRIIWIFAFLHFIVFCYQIFLRTY